jgi:lipopolysaccharide transport system ATP-binding protein
MIRLDHVSTTYRPKGRRGWRRRSGFITALDDVTLDVEAGEIVALIGANGAGKTTLLMTASGVIQPASGSLVVQGPLGPLITYSPGFHRELSGRENLIIGSVLLGASRHQAKSRYEAMAEFTEFDESILNAPIFTYSAGMIMRLGFAAIAFNDPAVLLIDEVLSVGDERFRSKCIRTCRDLVRRGAAMILVSHDMDLVRSSADRAGVLDRGRLSFIGLPEDAVAIHHRSMGATAEEPGTSI